MAQTRGTAGADTSAFAPEESSRVLRESPQGTEVAVLLATISTLDMPSRKVRD